MSNFEKIVLPAAERSRTEELNFGIGLIDPLNRIESGEITVAQIDILTEQLTKDVFYPSIDGDRLVPNAAGGSFSLVIADGLTTNRFRQQFEPAKQHAINVYRFLQDAVDDPAAVASLPRACVDGRLPVSRKLKVCNIGGHDADHVTGSNCGCGAEDKVGQILSYISSNHHDLRHFLMAHGINIDDDTHQLIINGAKVLLAEQYVSTGQDLKQAFLAVGGSKCIETLIGQHNEVALVINSQKNTTLDRKLLAQRFSDRYMVFNLDMSALKEAVQVVSLTDQEAAQKFIAALYFNVATTAVLAGSSLRVVVR